MDNSTREGFGQSHKLSVSRLACIAWNVVEVEKEKIIMKNQKSVDVQRVLLRQMFVWAFLFSSCHKGYRVLYEDDFSSPFTGCNYEGAENTASTSTARPQQPEARHRSHSSDHTIHWNNTFASTARPQQPEAEYYSRPSDYYPYWHTDTANVTRPQQPEVGYRSSLDDHLHWNNASTNTAHSQQPEVGHYSRLNDRPVNRNTAFFTDVTRSQRAEVGRRGRPGDSNLRGHTVSSGVTHPQQPEVGHLGHPINHDLHWTYPPPRSREAHPNQIDWGQRNSVYQRPIDPEPGSVQSNSHITPQEALDGGCPICGEEDAYKIYEAVQCTGCGGCICKPCFYKIREAASVPQDYDYHNDWAALFRTEFACPLCRKPF
ncbi:MAG: hypothetical protein MUC61_03155 [Amoebophilaceae bacterium]|jgi:hypothetical protein|nr:hypothetical protein [Amoebophilaceae bacterium]